MENIETVIPQNAQEAEAVLDALSSPESAAPEAPAPPEEWTLNYKGKEEKYPRDKILQFASQGRDYAQRLGDFNKRVTEWEKTREAAETKWKGLEEKLARYKEIEDYQKVDPAWWEHVNRLYESRLTEHPGGAQAPALPPEIQKKISEIDQVVTSLKERDLAMEREKEDQALDLQVSEYRKKYPNFDWETIDPETGLNLERRILKHAKDMGLSKPEHWRIAANDLLFEEHLKRAEHSAKEGTARHLEKVTKLGLGPVTDKRTMQIRPVQNVAAKSWDEISREAIEASGLT